MIIGLFHPPHPMNPTPSQTLRALPDKLGKNEDNLVSTTLWVEQDSIKKIHQKNPYKKESRRKKFFKKSRRRKKSEEKKSKQKSIIKKTKAKQILKIHQKRKKINSNPIKRKTQPL